VRLPKTKLIELIRESLLKERDEQGMLRIQTGSDSGSESQIPYSYTPRDDNKIIITNSEPRSKLSVTIDNRRGSVRQDIVSIKDLPQGTHKRLGPDDMGYASYGLFHLKISLITQNGNDLTAFVLLDKKPTSSGFELTVGR